MARDRIGNVVRALSLIPAEHDATLMVVQKVVNGLIGAWRDEFERDLSQFVSTWKPDSPEARDARARGELARWALNYGKLFSKNPDFSQVCVPREPIVDHPLRLIVVPQCLVEWTENRPLRGILELLERHGSGSSYRADLDEVSVNARDPRNGSYAVWVRDAQEADEEFSEKSANDLDLENHTGVTLLERLLLEVDYLFETGVVLDVRNRTLCTGSHDTRDRVPHVHWDGRTYVGWCRASDYAPDVRSRRVWV